MAQATKKVIFQDDRSSIEVSVDGYLVSLTTTLKGIPDSTVYLYKQDLEMALAFVNEVELQRTNPADVQEVTANDPT